MDEQKSIILSILKNFLGEPKTSKDWETRNQWEFNCQSHQCKNDINKFNLAFNSEKNIFKCWKCKDSGIVHKLVYKYGSQEDNKNLKLIMPTYTGNYVNVFRKNIINHNLITCPLPECYTPITSTIKTRAHQLAYDYMTKTRKISFNQLLEYKIGYTEIGAYKNRIIIPSFNDYGNINYFEARAFLNNVKPPYYKPDQNAFPNKNVPEKYDIIFNEKNINWDLPIYLVEGVFDMFRIPNSIPMLGKTPSWLLTSKLAENNCITIAALDEDAIKDSFEIYEQLSSLDLDVYFIDLSGKGDVSYYYEQNGAQAIVELLKTRKKIDFIYKFAKILN
jgi:hypothetical protein